MDQRPRLDDVAARVGVSTASVSLVLRGAPGPSAETRRRVLEAAAELGYRADRTASMLARRRRHLLGVMLDIRNPFHAELVEEIQAEADRVGYEVVLSTLTRHRDENRAIETLLDFRCEAVLLLGPDAPDQRLAALTAQAPVVALGRRVATGDVDVVRSADHVGVAEALDHLIRLGHRRIAFVDGGRGVVATARRRGYRDGMRRAGLADEIRIIAGDHTEEGGIRAGRLLAAGADRPTAVVASNDRCAVGVMDAFARAGIEVPGQISIVGYDDSTLAHLVHIDLTTVNQDAAAQARNAVLAAVQRLDEGRKQRLEVVLNPRLVVRGTTAPVPPTEGAPTARS
ncbi:LacI family DNA-binding transcriptional regulator [Actinoplanes sp. NPDC049599]|uniref:LacI family DNA-binding transcriptional regulator n=1 Tax=Actinoplanes sp. NPDC049599 TaxID=3363903 RepID=UPI0037B7D0D8